MNFNKHSALVGEHAELLGASNYHWLNYTNEKLASTYANIRGKERGTRLHAYAAESIALKQKFPRTKKTLNMYVNDAIGFQMVPEVVLYYSDNCFGTTDAISRLDDVMKTGILRIHDLKTGILPAHMEQLYIYAALFCLEYKLKPGNIDIRARIYQSDAIRETNPTSEIIVPIMDKIITFDKIIEKMKAEEE